MAKAWDVHGLRGDLRFDEAAGRVILTRWREMMSYRDGTLAGEDIEELHAMRVSSRRLRAAMDAFAEAFPRRPFRRRLKRVKEITDTLGDARDLDVAVEGLEAVLAEMEPEERPGIEGLIKEKKAFMRERPTPELLEFYNIGASQKVERYEITAYENLIDMAEKLGMGDAVELLEQNLQEEEATLNRLKALASEFDVTEETEMEEEELSSSRRS